MYPIQISTDVPADRRIVVDLPPETPLGKVDLLVVVTPQENDRRDERDSAGGFRALCGSVRSGDPDGGDNKRIDADLAAAYQRN